MLGAGRQSDWESRAPKISLMHGTFFSFVFISDFIFIFFQDLTFSDDADVGRMRWMMKVGKSFDEGPDHHVMAMLQTPWRLLDWMDSVSMPSTWSVMVGGCYMISRRGKNPGNRPIPLALIWKWWEGGLPVRSIGGLASGRVMLTSGACFPTFILEATLLYQIQRSRWSDRYAYDLCGWWDSQSDTLSSHSTAWSISIMLDSDGSRVSHVENLWSRRHPRDVRWSLLRLSCPPGWRWVGEEATQRQRWWEKEGQCHHDYTAG